MILKPATLEIIKSNPQIADVPALLEYIATLERENADLRNAFLFIEHHMGMTKKLFRENTK